MQHGPAELVVIIGPDGVRSVHFARDSYEQERATVGLYHRVQRHVDAIHQLLSAPVV